MALIKTSILSFIATAIKLASVFIINKAVSIYIGPSGLALIGQFQNFSQLSMIVAQGGLSTGITKYTAEYGKDSKRLPILLSTAARISLIASLIVGSVIIIFASDASKLFLKSEEYGYIFIIFGFTIILFVLNNFLLAVLNGLKEVELWAKINITQSIYGVIFTSLLIIFLGLDGALIALVTNQSIIFFLIIWMLRKHDGFKLSIFTTKFDKNEAKKLAGFAAMALTTAVTVPVSHLIVRNYIGESISWEDAGYWQAIWYISSMYLMVVTSTLGIYYLPRLSEITDRFELRKELWQGYIIILPIVFVMALSIFLLKDVVISVVFTEQFMPMRELFLWQLVGDFFKLAAFLLAYLLLAKAMTKTFIVTEVAFNLSYVLLSIWFVDNYGLVGMTYSFALNYLLYFITMIFVTRKHWA